MQLIEAFVRNPVKVSVGVLLVVMFGLLAVYRMPMQLTPEVQIPTVTIETRWPGASPQEVEREIILEQEERLKSVEGVNKMSSESMDSIGRITLEFAVGTNMSDALIKVNTQLQQVREYPEDALEPVIKTSNLSDRGIAYFTLGPAPPEPAVIASYQGRYPELRAGLDRVLSAPNSGVGMFRLRNLAEQHAELEPLIPKIDMTEYRRFAEDVIEARFERVKGVSDSTVMGGRIDELQVIVDPERLAARRLTIGDVRTALRGQNRDTSGGDFWEGKRRWVVRTVGQYREPDQVAQTIVTYRDGAPVYLRDVAEVKLGFRKPEGVMRRFGSERIGLNAMRETNANVIEVMAGLRQAVAELNAGILKQRGLQLIQVYDETEYIDSAVGLVTDNLIDGAILTFITLLLFLRNGRSTVIIFLHILVSTIGAFLIMGLLGRSLNVLALGGLAFAVGMLVDNAIVMLENIYRRHYQLGEDSMRASVRGAAEVWGALLNATLANLAVFLPVLFVQEEAGQLFRDIAIAVCAAVGLSMVVAVTVVPTAAKRFLKDDPHKKDELAPNGDGQGMPVGWLGRPPDRRLAPQANDRRLPKTLHAVVAAMRKGAHFVLSPLDAAGRSFVNFVVALNDRLLQGIVARLVTVVVFVGVAGLMTWALFPSVEYLPNGNRNLVIALLLPPPGYNVQQLVEIGQQLEADLRPYWDVDPGSPEAKALAYPCISDYFFVARGRQLFMGLRAADPQRGGDLIPLVREAASKIPGMLVVAKQTSLFESTFTSGRTVDVEIRGPDIHKLVALGGRIMGQVQEIVPGAQTIPQPSLDLSSPEIRVTPRREQAAELGISAEELGYTVDALVDGAYATDYYIGGTKIDLRIIGHPRLASHTQDLESLPVATRTGELVPLRAVADVELSSAPEQINRRERQRTITIQVTPPQEIPLETAMNRISDQIVQPLIDGGDLENGVYQIALAGTADKLRATWNALRFNVLLAVIITYLTMAATFESWVYPFVVILSVPIGAVGGFAGLWLLNLFFFQALDVLTMLGFVMLVGTVVNNPILIVEQALIHMRDEGMPMREAIKESLRSRIRPIFMTTFGGLIGLFPLVVSPGPGSELYRGIGAVLLGGLLISTTVTLVLVPTLLSLTIEMREGLRRLWKRPETPLQQPVVEVEKSVAV